MKPEKYTHLLLVDDEEDTDFVFKYYFEDLIEKQNFKLSFVSSAEEALKFLDSDAGSSVTTILTDINMPGMNGFQLLEKSKKLYPKLNILLMSAYSTNDYSDIALERGANQFFEKPINFASMLSYFKNNEL